MVYVQRSRDNQQNDPEIDESQGIFPAVLPRVESVGLDETWWAAGVEGYENALD